jgi:hypothetical protein
MNHYIPHHVLLTKSFYDFFYILFYSANFLNFVFLNSLLARMCTHNWKNISFRIDIDDEFLWKFLLQNIIIINCVWMLSNFNLNWLFISTEISNFPFFFIRDVSQFHLECFYSHFSHFLSQYEETFERFFQRTFIIWIFRTLQIPQLSEEIVRF